MILCWGRGGGGAVLPASRSGTLTLEPWQSGSEHLFPKEEVSQFAPPSSGTCDPEKVTCGKEAQVCPLARATLRPRARGSLCLVSAHRRPIDPSPQALVIRNVSPAVCVRGEQNHPLTENTVLDEKVGSCRPLFPPPSPLPPTQPFQAGLMGCGWKELWFWRPSQWVPRLPQTTLSMTKMASLPLRHLCTKARRAQHA